MIYTEALRDFSEYVSDLARVYVIPLFLLGFLVGMIGLLCKNVHERLILRKKSVVYSAYHESISDRFISCSWYGFIFALAPLTLALLGYWFTLNTVLNLIFGRPLTFQEMCERENKKHVDNCKSDTCPWKKGFKLE